MKKNKISFGIPIIQQHNYRNKNESNKEKRNIPLHKQMENNGETLE